MCIKKFAIMRETEESRGSETFEDVQSRRGKPEKQATAKFSPGTVPTRQSFPRKSEVRYIALIIFCVLPFMNVQ